MEIVEIRQVLTSQVISTVAPTTELKLLHRMEDYGVLLIRMVDLAQCLLVETDYKNVKLMN